jgi:hypothetical protein
MLLASCALLIGLNGVTIVTTSSVASAAVNSFTFSGGLNGTLKLIPADDCGGSSGGETQLDSIVGKLKGSKTDQWTIIVIAPKNGTFTIKPATTGLASSTVTLETPGKNVALSWDATKGSITANGNSGSVNVTLKGTTGGASGTVKIKGSWDCPS